MNSNDSFQRRWVGSLLSLLVPGAGIFIAGNRRGGVKWFWGITATQMLLIAFAPLSAVPSLIVCGILLFCNLALYCWMLVCSYQPVPKLRLQHWLCFLLLAFGVHTSKRIVEMQFTRAFKMPTRSMTQTIMPGDHLFVQRSAYWFAKPKRGDVIAFKTDCLNSTPMFNIPKDEIYLKRVAALPGELIEIKNGCLLVDGRPVKSPAILTRTNFAVPENGSIRFETNAVLIPQDACFVVGDNPTNSLDSRYFGPVPITSIYGKATKIFWPLNRSGDIP